MQLTIDSSELTQAVDEVMKKRGYVPENALIGRTIGIKEFNHRSPPSKLHSYLTGRKHLLKVHNSNLRLNNQDKINMVAGQIVNLNILIKK